MLRAARPGYPAPIPPGRVLTVLLVAVLWLLAHVSVAHAEILLGDGEQLIGQELEIWEDESGQATAAEALRRGRFSRSTELRPNHGHSRSAFFYRFSVKNAAGERRAFVLDAAREWVVEVDLYRVEQGKALLEARAGSSIPRAARALPVERPGFAIELAAGERRTYLLRLAGHAPMSLLGSISPRADFIEAHGHATLVWGGFYGVLLGIALYSAIVFGVLRDAQWRLAPALAALSLLEATAHGHVARLLPFFVPELELRGYAFAVAGCVWFFRSWSRVVLRTAQAPKLDRTLTAVTLFSFGLCLLGGLVPSLAMLAFIGPLPFAVALLLTGVARWRAGHALALPHVLAISAWLVPSLFVITTILGLLPLYPFTEHGNHVGAVVMAILLALIASHEMRATRGDLASAHSALEKQMQHLEQKNREVTSLADDLREQVVQRSRELSRMLDLHGSPSSTAPLEAGSVFEDRYQVVRRLGAGGMGVVYEVARKRDARRLALKVLTTAPTAQAGLRFTREAELGAGIQHPNVVAIIDVGLRKGITPFLVMELVEGGSLEEQRARFGDVPWALDMLRGVAAGLAALHETGVVHRDLKPSNVLVDGAVARICDFGIAKQVESESGHEPPNPHGATVELVRSHSRLTATGALIGTPLYMAPEALTERSIGPAADVYAFGLIAYELLTGAFPLALVAPSLVAAAASPPSLARISGLSPGIAKLLSACVSTDPGERPSAASIRDLLQREVTSSSVSREPPGYSP